MLMISTTIMEDEISTNFHDITKLISNNEYCKYWPWFGLLVIIFDTVNVIYIFR